MILLHSYSLLYILSLVARSYLPAGSFEIMFFIGIVMVLVHNKDFKFTVDFFLVTSAALLLLCLGITTLISSGAAGHPLDNIVGFFYYFYGMLISFIVYSIYRVNINVIERALVMIIFVIGFITLYEHISYFLYGGEGELLWVRSGVARSKGLFNNPNYYAASLLLVSGVLMSKVYFHKDKASSYLLIFIFIMIFFTFSKGAVICFIGGALFLVNFENLVKRLGVTIMLGVIVTIIYKIDIYGLGELYDLSVSRFADRLTLESDSSSSRLESLKLGYELFANNFMSIFFGIGFNNFISYSEHQVHNNYMRLLVEGGIVALLPFLIFLFLLLLKTYDFKKLKPKNEGFFILILFSVFSLTNDMFLVKEFWVGLGLVFIHINNDKAKKVAENI